jgi:hypothetical protein
MGSQDYLDDAGARRWRRIRYAVLAGFVAVFFFAFLIQAMADFAGWATSTQILFLVPGGLPGMITYPGQLLKVVVSLSMLALPLSLIFYWRMWKVEERSGMSTLLGQGDE